MQSAPVLTTMLFVMYLIFFQFGSDIPLQTEGPSGPGSEGTAPPARDAGRDCRVPMEDLPCPVEPPPLGMCCGILGARLPAGVGIVLLLITFIIMQC